MDERRFDGFTRALGAAASRRSAIAAALTMFGLGAAGAATDAAAAACRAGRQTCTRNDQCCSRQCNTSLQTPLRDRNRCDCGHKGTLCGNRCVRILADEQHCGACGNRCGLHEICCGGVCHDIRTDEEHCGRCGFACEPGETCCAGNCQNLHNDPERCGACDNVCHHGETCVSGTCVPPCAGLGDACDVDADCCYTDTLQCATFGTKSCRKRLGQPCSSNDECYENACHSGYCAPF